MSVSTGDTENKKNLVASSDINVVVSGDDLSLTLTNNIKEQLTTSVVNSYSIEVDDVYNAPYVNDVVKDVYSTTEAKTNKVWVNNKPIYRTVVDVGSLPNATTKNVSVSITNVDTITDMGVVGNSTSEVVKFNIYWDANTHDDFTIKRSGSTINSLRLVSSKDRSGYHGYATIEYTKTTD